MLIINAIILTPRLGHAFKKVVKYAARRRIRYILLS